MTAADPRAVAAAASVLGDRAAADVPLGPRTTYRVGGPATLLVSVEGDEDLRRVDAAVAESGLPVLVVGNGSNLLVADAGFPGLVLVLGEGFAGIEIHGRSVRAGAAALLPVVARRTAAAGLTGFEWAVGVPGSVGGAVRMNAGGHGSDMAAALVGVRVLDLRHRRGCGDAGIRPGPRLPALVDRRLPGGRGRRAAPAARRRGALAGRAG